MTSGIQNDAASASFFSRYGWGGTWWKEPSTIGKVKETCEEFQKVLGDPAFFSERMTLGMVKGVVKGLIGSDQENSALEGNTPDEGSSFAEEGFSVSTYVLKKFLANSKAIDLDPEDADLETRIPEILRKAKEDKESLKKTVNKVWDLLKKYHIIIGEISLDVQKKSSNETMRAVRESIEGKDYDGVSPIESVNPLQAKISQLRMRYQLKQPSLESTPASPLKKPLDTPPSAEELRKIAELELKTGQMLADLLQKIVHFTIMYTIHYLFSLNDDPSSFKQVLEEGGDFKEKYLERFKKGSCRYYFYRFIYELIRCLIEPIITETIQEVLDKLRAFLRNDIEMLNFVEKKIDVMSDYYSRIELARQDYLSSGRRGEAGIFKNYLKHTILLYDETYTEQDLIAIFNEFLVEFVPKPEIRIFGHHVPLLSSFLEWIVNSVRKGIVRYVLKKTGIVDKLLTEGTNSVQAAQVGLKRLLEQKMTQICEMIDKARNEFKKPDQKKVELPEAELEAKKRKILRPELDPAIQLHSFNLWRFIDIESCHGDERLLRNLDNPFIKATTNAVAALCTLIKIEPFLLDKVLEDATTGLMKTALLAVFEKNVPQTEVQLQTVLEVLNTSFTYVPENERREAELKFREECAGLDVRLAALQERLAHTAVATALKIHNKNSSGERHKAIKAYVEQERQAFHQFMHEFNNSVLLITTLSQEEYRGMNQTKELEKGLNQTITNIENYLNYIQNHIGSLELKQCYEDVQGDLYNIYAVTLDTMHELHESLALLAENLKQIKEDEEEIELTQKFRILFAESAKWNHTKAKAGLNAAQMVIPASIRESVQAKIKEMISLYETLEKNGTEREISERYLKIVELENRTRHKIGVLEQAKVKLNQLFDLCAEYQRLKNTREFPNHDSLEVEKSRLHARIAGLYQELLSSPEPLIQKYLVPLLKVNQPVLLNLHPFINQILERQDFIFQKVEEVKKWHEQKGNIIASELATITKPPELLTLKRERKEIKSRISEGFESVSAEVWANYEAKGYDIYRRRQSLDEIQNHFYDAQKTFSLMADQFSVKGCISIKQLKIFKKLAHARVDPRIKQATQTLIGTMGNSFHYKQLLLRLVFQDIANGSTSKTARRARQRALDAGIKRALG